MSTFHITSGESLLTYISESLSYSCLTEETRRQWGTHALNEWYTPLLRDGYEAIPFFFVLDLGGRMVHQGHATSTRHDTAPDAALYHRYTQALDRFCRDTVNRDVMADIGLHRRDVGVVLFLKRTIQPVLSEMSTLLAIEEEAIYGIQNISNPDLIPADTVRYHDLFTDFINTFTGLILDHIPAQGASIMEISEEDRRYVLGTALQEDVLSYPDVELIDRCGRMDDLPPLISDDQNRVIRTLQTIQLEQPMTRSNNPEGGYVGLRNNGGIEDLSNPVMSEWANPSPVLWEKLTNRNLLIYERASRTIHVRRMLLHLTLMNHSHLMQIDPVTGRLPLREIKFLMSAIIRDLTVYLGQIKSVEIQLNLQLVSHPGAAFQTHSVNLNDIPADRVRHSHHFLLDERDIFPWFFSTDLSDSPAFVPFDPESKTSLGDLDLQEECLPERDLMFGEHAAGFENVHHLVFCADDLYQSSRHRVIDHMRDFLDLGLTSLDSLLFIVLRPARDGADELDWHLDPVHQFHREFDPDDRNGDDDASPYMNDNLSEIDIREAVRRYFLSRLLGVRFRSSPTFTE